MLIGNPTSHRLLLRNCPSLCLVERRGQIAFQTQPEKELLEFGSGLTGFRLLLDGLFKCEIAKFKTFPKVIVLRDVVYMQYCYS
jgi:hypothetical protein